VHLKKVTLGNDVDAAAIAALTPGFTGADLANLVNEAALVATRRSGSAVDMADFTAAIERIVAGLEKKNRILNERERSIVAHHEMGHALVSARSATPIRCTRCRSSRAGSARSATRFSGRPRSAS
jgi:cell division protease FtsH